MLTVLITCALGDYIGSTVKCIKNNFDHREVKVVGTDMRRIEFDFNDLDRFYKVPQCTDKNYIQTIFDICSANDVDVVIPTNTAELENFENHVHMFEKVGIAVATAGRGVSLVNSKDGLHDLMLSNGIDCVRSAVIENIHEARAFISENGEDKTYCIKQLHNCGARGFKVLTSERPESPIDKGTDRLPLSALEELLDAQGPMLIQEYLDGCELSVDMLCDKGKVLYSVVKRNDKMLNGVAQISSIVKDSYAENICAMVVEAASLNGNVGFDIKYSSQGKPFIIDCNPRLTATVALSAAAGINLPYLGIKYALGEELPKLEMNEANAVCIRRTNDYFFNKVCNTNGCTDYFRIEL